MAEKLDFSLPQKKPAGSAAGVLTVLLLTVLVALAGANLFIALSGDKPAARAAGDLSADQAKALAAKLTQRNLDSQAATAWQDYLASAELSGPERARIHFQIGTLLERAGRHADAIEHYYRSESAAELDELRSELTAHLRQCFESLGAFAALRYEMMDRTSLNPSDAAGGKVVAEIGAEKITEARLDALIEESIESRLAPMKAFMTPEQLNEQKKRALEQSRSPQARQEFLQNWLAQEILYRQALQEELSEKPHVKRLAHELRRELLSQQLLNERLAAKINITETDLQTYYAAHKSQYVEPARAKVSHILVSEEPQAKDLLGRLQEGADFAELAREFSQDAGTRDAGGRIAEDVFSGAGVPGIGDANDLNAAIFAAGPGLLDRPFPTDEGWEIVRVNEKRPERQMTFEEVRQQLTRELLRRKSQDVQREYVTELMDKHKVIIHTSVLSPAQQESAMEAPSPP